MNKIMYKRHECHHMADTSAISIDIVIIIFTYFMAYLLILSFSIWNVS